MGQIDGAEVSPEMTAHFARYLCVRLSGLVEASVKELVIQYSRTHSSLPVQRYVARQVGLVRNIDREGLKQIIESMNPTWWQQLEADYADEIDAFGSIAAVRNSVSHGGDAGITIATIHQYFAQVRIVLDGLAGYLDPVA